MTTTPTLYVKGYYTRFGSQLPDGSYNATDVPTEREATHDELIAEMPRCGTCDRWEEAGHGTELGTCRVVDETEDFPVLVGKDFGCTEHKEKQ